MLLWWSFALRAAIEFVFGNLCVVCVLGEFEILLCGVVGVGDLRVFMFFIVLCMCVG